MNSRMPFSRSQPNHERSERSDAPAEDFYACPFDPGGADGFDREIDFLQTLPRGVMESSGGPSDYENLSTLLDHFTQACGQACGALTRLLRAREWLAAPGDESDAALLEALERSRRQAMEKGRAAGKA